MNLQYQHILDQYPERSSQIKEIFNSIKYGNPMGEILFVKRTIDDDALMIIKETLNIQFPNLLCQTKEFTSTILKEMEKDIDHMISVYFKLNRNEMKLKNVSHSNKTSEMKQSTERNENEMEEEHNENEEKEKQKELELQMILEEENDNETYVLIIDNIEKNMTKQQMEQLEFIKSFSSRKGKTIHFILTTYQSLSVTYATHYRYIHFDRLTSSQLLSMCLTALKLNPEDTTSREYGLISYLIKIIYPFNPTRMFCLTEAFNILEYLKSNENIEQSKMIEYINLSKQPLILGSKKIEKETGETYNQSFHLNYLILAAYHLIIESKSGRDDRTANSFMKPKKKSFSIQTVFIKYNQECPNPLSYDMFILLFKSAVKDHYFISSNKNGCPFLVDLYQLALSSIQCEEIERIVHGEDINMYDEL